MNKTVRIIAFLTIIAIGVLLRVWGIAYDVPYIYHPDEPTNIIISQNIVKNGDVNPHFFRYPSLFFYIRAAGYVPFYLVQKAKGNLQSLQGIPAPISLTLGVTKAPIPEIIVFDRLLLVYLLLSAQRLETARSRYALTASIIVK